VRLRWSMQHLLEVYSQEFLLPRCLKYLGSIAAAEMLADNP
jgi:hypothetical protein